MKGVNLTMNKKLYRSRKDYMIAGVCGGIAEYFEIDSTLVRLLAVLVVLVGGAGVVAYIIAWIVIPKNPDQVSDESFEEREKIKEKVKKGTKDVIKEVKEHFESEELSHKSEKNRRILGGIIVIAVGLIFLLNGFFPWVGWNKLWPVILIAVGITIMIQAFKKKD
jgi:phage shock protein C